MSWPTAVATDADLKLLKNNLSTTLNGSVNNSTTTIVLTDASGFPTAGFVTIDSEAISYTGKSTNTLTGVTRGADSTTAASHANSAPVYHLFVADHHNKLKDELISVETTISKQWKDVRRYGAVGDGITDDRASIQAAIDAAAVGDTVFIPSGTYFISSSLSITKSISFCGMSRSNAVLYMTANSAMLLIDLSLADIYFLDIHDIRFESNNGGSSSIGVRITGTHGLFESQIRDNQFRGCYAGIAHEASGEGSFLRVTGNLFDSYAAHRPAFGLYFTGKWGTGSIISHNQFLPDTTTGVGIFMTGTSIGDTVIVANHFEGGANSIHLVALTPFTYTANFVVVGNKMDTVIQPVTLVHITGSTFFGNRYIGGIYEPIEQDAGCSLNIVDTDNGNGLAIPRRFIVGGTVLHASATVQVDSTTQGFLPPRMTTTQRDAISSPAEGLVVYNSSTHKLNVRVAAAWEAVTSA